MKLGDVLDQLLQWLRVCEVQARKDQDRPLLPWWAAMTASIQALDLSRVGSVREVLPRRADLDHLRSMLLGVYASFIPRVQVNKRLSIDDCTPPPDFDYWAAVNNLILMVDEAKEDFTANHYRKYFDQLRSSNT